MNPRQSQAQLIGYCPGCKEEIYYNWDDDICISGCICERRTSCKDLLRKRKEEEES